MLATMVTSGVSYAQQNAQQQDAQDPNAPAPQAYRAKVILGAKVSLEGNTSVGTVDDIVLDENGNVDYLIVANADGQLVTVPWDAAVFNPEQRVATVHITPEQFQKVPTYTAKQYPVYSTPAYRTQVYQHYGLTPGQSRRLIRRGGAVVVPKAK
jgi:sporulation protein YlmC with PRC-barrel domain